MLRKWHRQLAKNILHVIDLIYPIFRKIMPLQTYRYAACGGFNTALGIVLYFIGYNFIFKKENIDLGFKVLSPHIAADYLFAIWIALPINFYLNRYVVFLGGNLRKRTQFVRFLISTFLIMVLNYLLLKFFVEGLQWYPTPSKILTMCIIITSNYTLQRNFSFK
jgi:putative flippase GtrA